MTEVVVFEEDDETIILPLKNGKVTNGA